MKKKRWIFPWRTVSHNQIVNSNWFWHVLTHPTPSPYGGELLADPKEILRFCPESGTRKDMEYIYMEYTLWYINIDPGREGLVDEFPLSICHFQGLC